MSQGEEFKHAFEIAAVNDPKIAAKKTTMKLKRLEKWSRKAQHGFLFKTREKIKDADSEKTRYWLIKSNITSHAEGYICAIQ